MAHARRRQLLACLRRVLLLHRKSLLVLAVLSRTTRAGSIGRRAVLPRRPLKLWARILEVWPPIVALPSRRVIGAVSRQQCSLEQPGDAAMLRTQDAGFAVQQAVTPASSGTAARTGTAGRLGGMHTKVHTPVKGQRGWVG